MRAHAHDYSYAGFIQRPAELPHSLGFYTDPSNMLPTTHPLDPLAITLIPQLRAGLFKVCFLPYPLLTILVFTNTLLNLFVLVTLIMNFKITSTTIYYMSMKNNIFRLLFFICFSNYQHVIYSSYNAIDR